VDRVQIQTGETVDVLQLHLRARVGADPLLADSQIAGALAPCPVCLLADRRVLAWYTKLLFDKGHRVLLEAERNLLFLMIDLLMFVTLLAVVLRGGPQSGFGTAGTTLLRR
jgi:hypothetical protein